MTTEPEAQGPPDPEFAQLIKDVLLANGIGDGDEFRLYIDPPMLPYLGRGSLWVAADLGLLICHFDNSAERPGVVKTQLCPWKDVINPEYSVEFWRGAVSEVRLLIQIPRVELGTAVTSRLDDLARFATEVMRRCSQAGSQ